MILKKKRKVIEIFFGVKIVKVSHTILLALEHVRIADELIFIWFGSGENQKLKQTKLIGRRIMHFQQFLM